MKPSPGHIAVVTGGGAGMGRELCIQLARAGLHVAACDLNSDKLIETEKACRAAASSSTQRFLTFQADISDEVQCCGFRETVALSLETKHVNFLFNNAGVSGGGSFIAGERSLWENCFNVCWGGVYNMCRAFMDMLLASSEGAVINTSSVNGFWASLGPDRPHTAYSAAKFAVKGFTEALINDFKQNAPHLKAFLVMPGYVGTDIAINSAAQIQALVPSSAKEKEVAAKLGTFFRDNPQALTAVDAATIILREMELDNWRILVGDDAEALDAGVRLEPKIAVNMEFRDVAKLGNPNWKTGMKTQLVRLDASKL